jgi:hypothetical protein
MDKGVPHARARRRRLGVAWRGVAWRGVAGRQAGRRAGRQASGRGVVVLIFSTH